VPESMRVLHPRPVTVECAEGVGHAPPGSKPKAHGSSAFMAGLAATTVRRPAIASLDPLHPSSPV
jgi:hypothetical protein